MDHPLHNVVHMGNRWVPTPKYTTDVLATPFVFKLLSSLLSYSYVRPFLLFERLIPI
jgi:hypothetical protein